MKLKKLILAGTLLSLSTSALATQARLYALGMTELDNEGSYYIEDERNIFLNSANVADYGDTLMMEWGDKGTSANLQSHTTLNSHTSPNAEGGVLKKVGQGVAGVYLGNESVTSSMLRILSTSYQVYAASAQALNPQSLPTSDNVVDLFYAGGDSLKWGVNLVYGSYSSKTTTEDKSTSIATRLGLKTSQWDTFANISIKSDSEATDTVGNTSVSHKFEGKLGLHLGGSYKLRDHMRVFAGYKKFDWEQTDSYDYGATLTGKTGVAEGSFTTLTLGLGNRYDFDKRMSVFSKLFFTKTDIEVKLSKTVEVSKTVLPIVVGFEYGATDWLTLRGSVIQNLYGQTKNKNYDALNLYSQSLATASFGADTDGKAATIANSTEVRAGASLIFGKLTLDGFIGVSPHSRVGTTGVSNTNQGTWTLDNALTRVGMTYKF